jgi:hypothetical protein
VAGIRSPQEDTIMPGVAPKGISAPTREVRKAAEDCFTISQLLRSIRGTTLVCQSPRPERKVRKRRINLPSAIRRRRVHTRPFPRWIGK